MTETQTIRTEKELRDRRLDLLRDLHDAERRTSDTIFIPNSQLPPDTVILMGMIQAITWWLGEDPRDEKSWIHSCNEAGRHRLKTERQVRQKRESLWKGLRGFRAKTSGVIHTPEGRSTADERALLGMIELFTWGLGEHVREQESWEHQLCKPKEEYTFDDWVGVGVDPGEDPEDFEAIYGKGH